jgi:hypothetical protein
MVGVVETWVVAASGRFGGEMVRSNSGGWNPRMVLAIGILGV